jgi:hypothetical protein
MDQIIIEANPAAEIRCTQAALEIEAICEKYGLTFTGYLQEPGFVALLAHVNQDHYYLELADGGLNMRIPKDCDPQKLGNTVNMVAAQLDCNANTFAGYQHLYEQLQQVVTTTHIRGQFNGRTNHDN